MIEYILNPQTVEALGWTLLHSIWHAAAFAIILVVILIALRSYSAQSRYIVSVGLLSAFFLTVTATFWQQWQEADHRVASVATTLNKQSVDKPLILNSASDAYLIPGINNIQVFNGAIVDAQKSSWLIVFRDYYKSHLPLLVTIWFLGVLFLQLRFLGQLAYVQRLKHYGTQIFPESWTNRIEVLEDKLRIQKKVSYLTSIRVESPMVIGWLKPVVLLPKQLFNSLTETEIYAVLAHELAHIRREDFIVNLMQTFLVNVFFFHPGVWWMSNRIDDEREHCCDDLAVAATGQATSYAKTLINVSELQLQIQASPAMAMALSGKNNGGGFSGRIRRLVIAGNKGSNFREGFATASILITALIFGVVATGQTIQDIEIPSPTQINKVEEVPDIKATQNEGCKTNSQTSNITSTTITTTIEATPISKINQTVNQNGLPIADPEPVAQIVGMNSTRIDALVMACEEGDFDFVKTLISSGIDVNGIGSDGFTPLMMAISQDETKIVEFLINKGADVNQSINGWTALIEAADEGSISGMNLLLKAGADVNYYLEKDYPTALSMAASEGHLDCLQLLLDYGAEINGVGKSVPPLHIAAAEGQNKIVDYLIAKKIELNKKDQDGFTAFMYAAFENHKSVMEKLKGAGADTSIIDSDGSTISDDSEDDNDRLKRTKFGVAKKPAILQATSDGLIEKVEQMVRSGVDVNTQDNEGQSSLHIAASKNHNIDMKVLIDLGADINARDNDGRTPIMYAAAAGKLAAVELLIAEGANIYIVDREDMGVEEWAKFGRNEKIKSLFDSDAKADSKYNNRKLLKNKTSKQSDKTAEKSSQKESGKREKFHISNGSTHLIQYDINGKMPDLLEMTRSGSIGACQKLLNEGHSANTSDDTGQTALMIAASTNQINIAKLLIRNGADVNKSSVSGLTALHYAALENYDSMTRLLLKHGANIDAKMRYSSTDGNFSDEPLMWEYIGATPLLIAVESGNLEVLTILIDAGANTNQSLSRKEYRLSENRESYLTGSEVMGLDEEFLDEMELIIHDKNWTPYRQALLLDDQEILILFPKK